MMAVYRIGFSDDVKEEDAVTSAREIVRENDAGEFVGNPVILPGAFVDDETGKRSGFTVKLVTED